MHIFGTDPELLPTEPPDVADLEVSGPIISVLYELSGTLMELLGPIFWAALVVLFIQAELFTN